MQKGPILIVDDDPNLREVVRVALELQHFDVVEAHDGRAGVEAFEKHHPVAIVLDLMMPELDGFDVCRRIRATSRVPIVFLSSRDDELDRVLGLELGGDDYVTKPFSPRELVARVKAVLRRAEPAPAPVADAPKERTLTRGPLSLDLEPTPDVAATLNAHKRPGQRTIGFALQTHDGHAKAAEKMARKHFDGIVLNALDALGGDSGGYTWIEPGAAPQDWGTLPKPACAHRILARAAELLSSPA